MKIMYVHGFGSKFDESNPKVKLLKILGDVVGLDIDYSTEDPISKILRSKEFIDVDLIVGTSMGGWVASHVGSISGIPWVAINPALEPSKSLLKYCVSGEVKTDFVGREILLTKHHIKSVYDKYMKYGGGLILLDEDDEIFDSKYTYEELDKYSEVIMFKGGSHRFEHMKESLMNIMKYYERSYSLGITE